ncbi:MAG: hypothetical protein QOE51_187, partial [Actinoplanes sp.]|nr:hypothetical protein [Actinoplanes sp.]
EKLLWCWVELLGDSYPSVGPSTRRATVGGVRHAGHDRPGRAGGGGGDAEVEHAGGAFGVDEERAATR